MNLFNQIAEKVTVGHPNIGDLEYVLKKSLTIDRRHPTVEGYSVLGEALALVAGLLSPLSTTGTHERLFSQTAGQ